LNPQLFLIFSLRIDVLADTRSFLEDWDPSIFPAPALPQFA
jgi:hypothetical protein